MRVSAYVLAGDPTWIHTSVLSYYPYVQEILVSYDRSGLGWTGRPNPVDNCLTALRGLDSEGKLRFVGGQYSDPSSPPLDCETRQRRAAIAAIGPDVDWILQIDTDEVLPSYPALELALKQAGDLTLAAVEWPMRVLYRRLRNGGYLGISGAHGELHVEYPGAIAVRPNTTLEHCRRAPGPVLRMCVAGDATSPQVRSEPQHGEVRSHSLLVSEAIWHNSWARSSTDIRRKISTWGHAAGLRSQLYYARTWLPAPISWRWLRDLHPFARGLWPRLERLADLPIEIHPHDEDPR